MANVPRVWDMTDSPSREESAANRDWRDTSRRRTALKRSIGATNKQFRQNAWRSFNRETRSF